jgi:multidrug transporter EmrE-like cation transporter
LSVVVPVFNEEARLESSLNELAAFLRKRVPSHEILAVDDGSFDATPAILAGMARKIGRLKVLCLPHNRGKGAAVREGFRRARGRTVLFMDCDLSTPPSDIPAAIAAIEWGNDAAIGSRRLPQSRIPVPQPLLRRLAGRAFNLAVRVMLGLPYKDTQCGFKAFSARAAQTVVREGRINGFAFDAELLLLAAKHGYRVAELPVTWRDRAHSTVRLLKHAPRMFTVLLALKRRFSAVIPYHPARALPLILFSCAGAVLGQIFFKKGALGLSGVPFGPGFVLGMAVSPDIWIGLAFFGASALTWLMSLARVDLSFAFPMLSLNFVFTALYAWSAFGEHLSTNRVTGIALIIAGVMVISVSGAPGASAGSAGDGRAAPAPLAMLATGAARQTTRNHR